MPGNNFKHERNRKISVAVVQSNFVDKRMET